MDQLQAKGVLMSWQIYEEKSGSVCVKLRYDCHESDDQSSMNTVQQVSYKKKTQKQMDRDFKRAQEFQDKGVSTRSRTKAQSEIENPRSSSVSSHLDSETIDLHVNALGAMSALCNTPEQVEETSLIDHDLDSSVMVPDPEVYSPVLCTNKAESADLVEPVSDHKRQRPRDHDSRCNICGSYLGMCWRRCTHIDHPCEYNICNTCYHTRGHKHIEHSDQLTMFTNRPDSSDGCKHACASCGDIFKDKISEIVKCKRCDMYILCDTCFRKNQHKGHAYYMEKILVGQL